MAKHSQKQQKWPKVGNSAKSSQKSIKKWPEVRNSGQKQTKEAKRDQTSSKISKSSGSRQKWQRGTTEQQTWPKGNVAKSSQKAQKVTKRRPNATKSQQSGQKKSNAATGGQKSAKVAKPKWEMTRGACRRPPPPGGVRTPSILGWCRHGRGQQLCRQDVVPNKTKQKLKRGPQPQPAHTLFTRQAPFSHRTAMPSWGRSLVPGAAAAASSAPATCSTVVCPRQAGPAKGQGPVRPVHGVHSSQPLNETVPPRGHMTANNKATVFTPPSRQKYLGWGVALSGNPCGGLC